MAAVTAGLALLVSGPGAHGEAREPASPTPQEILVEALSDTGGVITEQVAAALAVATDERELETTDLGPVGNQWRLVVYFDLLLASTNDFHNATVQLAERARELTRLGSVELIVAGEEVTTALPANSDPEALSQALGWLRMRDFSENSQVEVRRAFLEQLGLEQMGAEEAPPSEAAVELDSESVLELARFAQADEAELLRRHREQLMLWAVENASPGPQALFLVGSGFDAEPNEFYRQVLAESPWSGVIRDLHPQPIQPSVVELGQVLSVYDWTVLSYLPEQRGDALLEETEEEARAREEEEMVDVVYQDGRVVDRTTVGFDALKALKRRKRDAETRARPLLLDAEQPFADLAKSTGGELLRGVYQLSDLLVRLGQRHRLVVSPPGTEVAAPRRLQVLLRGERATGVPEGAIVRSRQWIAGTTPEAVSAVRARRILSDELHEGELTLSAAVQGAEAEGAPLLIVQRDSYEEDPAALAGPLRVTVAVADEEGPIEISHRRLDGWEIPLDGDPTLELPIESVPEGVLVVLVEELDSRRWGGTFATFVEAAGMRTAGGYDALFLPAPKVIHLLAPSQGFAMGPTVFETVISQPEVAQVDFYLDGEREAVRRTPPFTADLDLGSLPQPRRVEVIARDEDGLELGRDYLIVNEGSGVFGVRILKPRLDPVDGKPPRLVGPVDVEAEVEPRRGEGIDRVEFFWKETLVATRYARPYRQRVVIPEDDSTGFLRVVAYLEDGASSEDVVFVNSIGPSERLMVNLMELYVVVTDRKGKPVKGLPQEVFRITEEEEPQEIATFSDAGDLPLTVGMVIDSSASMFVKLPDVQVAAGDFLRGLETRRDRAFVVGFGDDPRMTRSTTSDLPAVISSLGALRPDGQTAIWKAMTYSLVQLQGVPGKKALVVYTDGADEDPDFSYRTLLKFARKVGVPIYVILSNNEIRRTEGKGLNVKDFLDRLETLTNSVGGRVYFARVGEDLQDVYAEIAEELRSQYVVGYYSVDTGGREWRNVEVDVDKPGYKARTIAGYYR